MKAQAKVGWWMEKPNGTERPQVPTPWEWFDRQNWWCDAPEIVTPVAATYELVRRHQFTGALLAAETKPIGALAEFLHTHARLSWLRLTPPAQRDFESILADFNAYRSDGPKSKDTSHQRLNLISRFEATELERHWQTPEKPADCTRRRSVPHCRRANQNERRAFERVCRDAFLSLCGA